jgi:hypothetical protein
MQQTTTSLECSIEKPERGAEQDGTTTSLVSLITVTRHSGLLALNSSLHCLRLVNEDCVEVYKVDCVVFLLFERGVLRL